MFNNRQDQRIMNVNAKDFKGEMQGEYILIDVRTPQEYQQGKIENAINIAVDILPGKLGELSEYKDKKVLLYCLSGARSASAARFLSGSGFTKVYNLSGGIMAWQG